MKMTQPSMVEALAPLEGMPERLRSLAQPRRLRSALQRSVPEFSSGALTLEHVEPRRLRLKDSTCTAIFDLNLRDEDGGSRIMRLDGRARPGRSSTRSGRCWGTFGKAGWRCTVPELGLVIETPPPDTALPALPVLTDPAQARRLLEDGIRRGPSAHRDIRIESCIPTITRYKAGSRCTIIYELRFESGTAGRDWPTKVVAKTYRGNKGRIAFEGMRALWESPLRTSTAVSIAEPLGFLEDLNVLLQGSVPGDVTLEGALEEGLATGGAGDTRTLHRLMAKTARGLAALHRSGASGLGFTWDEELAEVRGRIVRLARWHPGIDDALAPSLSTLENLCREHPPQDLVASHRSFRPAQVLLSGQDIAFIDFDGFREAEPAMDVALFRATAKRIATQPVIDPSDGERSVSTLEGRLTEMDVLCDTFMRQYENAAPISRERVALWETLYLLTNVLNAWIKVRPERLAGTLEVLGRHLRDGPLPPV